MLWICAVAQRAIGLFGEDPGAIAAAFLQGARKQGHEAGREGALGDQAAEQVGKAKGDEKGVGDRAGTEQRRDQDIAREAENAAEERVATDRGGGAEQGHRRPV